MSQSCSDSILHQTSSFCTTIVFVFSMLHDSTPVSPYTFQGHTQEGFELTAKHNHGVQSTSEQLKVRNYSYYSRLVQTVGLFQLFNTKFVPLVSHGIWQSFMLLMSAEAPKATFSINTCHLNLVTTWGNKCVQDNLGYFWFH